MVIKKVPQRFSFSEAVARALVAIMLDPVPTEPEHAEAVEI